MRLVLASLMAVGLAGCAAETPKPPPPAPQVVARPKPVLRPPTIAPVCARPEEKVALAMAALRMQLSVTELSCDARDQFNAFTNRYRNDVAAENKTLGGFFNRAYGRRGQSQQDEYETSQINQTSEQGTYYGTDFCKTQLPMFGEIQALKNATELENYAVARNFDQVIQADACPASAAPAPKAPARPAKPAPVKPAAKS